MTNTPKLKSFEYFGCSGVWSEESTKTDVWRIDQNNGVVFLVRHSDTCGLETATRPGASWRNGVLDLNYKHGNSDGIIAMCECEYWVRFTFGPEYAKLSKVTFRGGPPILRGDWPDER
jgi:hypothetical protein